MSSTWLFTGGSGFLAVRTAAELLRRQPDAQIVLTDLVEHDRLQELDQRVSFQVADLSGPGACKDVMPNQVDVVVHLASLVSGGAERDFDAGMKANVHLTMHLLEAARATGRCPRLVFASSIATFGGEKLPAEIDDWTHQHPQNSYGVAKVIGEQLINDYTRKGFLDGRGVRLPAIVVRDEPNTAASGYASSIIREPIQGRDYVCPVGPEDRIPIMSIERCVELLLALAQIDGERLGDYRTLNAHGISPTAGEIAEAINERRAEDPAIGRITFEPQADVQQMIAGWPRIMHAPRADDLGLPGESGVDDIIARYAQAQTEAQA